MGLVRRNLRYALLNAAVQAERLMELDLQPARLQHITVGLFLWLFPL